METSYHVAVRVERGDVEGRGVVVSPYVSNRQFLEDAVN